MIIDAPTATAARAARFWAAALGATAGPFAPAPQFTSLHHAIPGLVTAVQAVDDDPRIHLDFETDDVAAETARLIALGAQEVSQWQECRVLSLRQLEVAGQRAGVVGPQSARAGRGQEPLEKIV
ncbi:VOC family protein [Streptomyces tendae]